MQMGSGSVFLDCLDCLFGMEGSGIELIEISEGMMLL